MHSISRHSAYTLLAPMSVASRRPRTYSTTPSPKPNQELAAAVAPINSCARPSSRLLFRVDDGAIRGAARQGSAHPTHIRTCTGNPTILVTSVVSPVRRRKTCLRPFLVATDNGPDVSGPTNHRASQRAGRPCTPLLRRHRAKALPNRMGSRIEHPTRANRLRPPGVADDVSQWRMRPTRKLRRAIAPRPGAQSVAPLRGERTPAETAAA